MTDRLANRSAAPATGLWSGALLVTLAVPLATVIGFLFTWRLIVATPDAPLPAHYRTEGELGERDLAALA
ncbi:MAG: hypothetical protein NZM12_01260, partial [Steroidobacteraceae bacterium]|nr:hypothetical protein [Steroidobacteraceae bacterium]